MGAFEKTLNSDGSSKSNDINGPTVDLESTGICEGQPHDHKWSSIFSGIVQASCTSNSRQHNLQRSVLQSDRLAEDTCAIAAASPLVPGQINQAPPLNFTEEARMFGSETLAQGKSVLAAEHHDVQHSDGYQVDSASSCIAIWNSWNMQSLIVLLKIVLWHSSHLVFIA